MQDLRLMIRLPKLPPKRKSTLCLFVILTLDGAGSDKTTPHTGPNGSGWRRGLRHFPEE